MELFWIYHLLLVSLSGEPKWIQLVRKGLKCPNGSHGSSKSSFSFISRWSMHVLSVSPSTWSKIHTRWKCINCWCQKVKGVNQLDLLHWCQAADFHFWPVQLLGGGTLGPEYPHTCEYESTSKVSQRLPNASLKAPWHTRIHELLDLRIHEYPQV